MRFSILIIIAFSLIACTKQLSSESKFKVEEKSESYHIPSGIYFSYKKCDINQNCEYLEPEKKNNGYYLNIMQHPKEERVYLLVKNNKYYLYSLQYFGELQEPAIFWSDIVRLDSQKLTFHIDKVNQVVGSDYFGRYDNNEIDKKLSTAAKGSGLIKIGELIQGNAFSASEYVSFHETKDGYTVDCAYLDENTPDESQQKKDTAYNLYFYYQCNGGEKLFFKKVD